ncbi:uncharacterized protein LOC100908082 [Galendromus occidentalis]|uniref:Uncharacterized protein LOC100908082 n=1 Tax=Galendromus occidentalis TaxID=34638 RepID=A0AAJ7P9P9_9ACAR|nr:uncharacterized protein LOC100908082 [Galendromus occidentalis]
MERNQMITLARAGEILDLNTRPKASVFPEMDNGKEEFRVVTNSKSWVWLWFKRSVSQAKAQCNVCFDILKKDRTTSSLIKHLKTKHGVSKTTVPPSPSTSDALTAPSISDGPSTPQSSSSDPTLGIEEEEQPPAPSKQPPAKKRKQMHLDSFLNKNNSVRKDALRLICESNISMNQIATSGTLRRLFSQVYPSDPPLPKSGTTLTSYLHEDAKIVTDKLRVDLRAILARGNGFVFTIMRLPSSFPYCTIEAILGRSCIAPLGLIRVEDRATGEYLKDRISARLEGVGLSPSDFAVAATDGARNVLRAVDLLGVKQQKCYAHGLDLVVKKVIYGKDSLAFNIGILATPSDQDGPETDEERIAEAEENSENDVENEIASGPGAPVVLGEAVERLRKIARDFRKKPNLMDEIRKERSNIDPCG